MFCLISLILFIFFNFSPLVRAHQYTRSKNYIDDLGLEVYEQTSYIKYVWDTQQSDWEKLSLDKDYIEVVLRAENEDGCNTEVYFAKVPAGREPVEKFLAPDGDVVECINYDIVKELIKHHGSGTATRRWEGTVDRNFDYYVKTYAHRVAHGYSKATVYVKEYPDYNLSINNTQNGKVKITHNGTNLGTYSNHTEKIRVLETVSLTADPDFGFEFDYWSGDASGTSSTTNVTIKGDTSVRAVFRDNYVKPVTFPSNEFTPAVKGGTVRWNSISDYVGIDYYNYSITTSSSYPYSPKRAYTTEKSVTGLTSRKSYYLWVQGVDDNGNKGSWRKKGTFSPDPESSDISIQPSVEESGGTAVHKMTLQVQDVDANRYYFYRRRLKSIVSSTTGPWEYIGSYSYNYMKNNNFKIADHDVVKHNKYQYKVRTKNVKSQYSSFKYSTNKSLLNVTPDYNVSKPLDQTYTNIETHSIDINPKTDLENDNLRFRVIYKKGDQDYNSGSYSNTPIPVSFDSDGKWEWWVEVEESDGNGFRRLDTSSKRTLYIDNQKPNGSMEVKEPSGTQVFSQSQPTNTRQVDLHISNLTDAAGLVDSGVKGIYLWNGTEPTTFKGLSTITESELSTSTTGVYITLTAIPDIVNWTLTEGSDGDRKVSMKIVDNAGNERLIEKVVMLDQTPPESPTLFSHSPDEFNESDIQDSISISWKADDIDGDIVDFIATYNIDGREVPFTDITFTEVETGTIRGEVNLDTSHLEANQEIAVKVITVDKAGNMSAETNYSAYTKAELGQVSYHDGGYNKTREEHYISWLLDNPGIASTHIVEYGQVTEEGFIKTGEIYPDANNIFLHSGLAPHGTYTYRLVAVNGAGDKTRADTTFDQTVPNVPPEVTELIRPANFERPTVDFSFLPTEEYDGDTPVKYHIYFGEGANPTTFEKVETVLAGETVTREGLIHTNQYTWYITADDGLGGLTNSEKVTFTVDDVRPDLEPEKINRPYTNQSQIEVRVNDDVSGIKDDRVYYKKINSNDNKVFEDDHITVTHGGNGDYTGNISLNQGEYHLYTYVEDKAGNITEKQLSNLQVDLTKPTISQMTVNLDMADGMYLANTGRIPVRINASDDYSKLAGIRYWFVSNKGDEVGVRGRYIPVTTELNEFNYNLRLDGLDGNQYYLAIGVEDRAGNRSIIKYSDPIYLDTTPPEISYRFDGLSSYGSSYYLNDLSNLDLNVEPTDDESEIGTIEYAVINSDTEEIVIDWTDWTTIGNSSLTSGQGYQIAIRVTNNVGLANIVQTEEFIFDDSPPINPLLDGPTEPMVSGEILSFAIGGEDDESPVVSYRLAIGSSYGERGLTEQLPDSEDGWLEIEPSTEQLRIELPEIESGRYYPVMEIINGVGLKTEIKGSPFEIDNSLERVVVGDQGPYTMFDDRLTGWWSYNGSQEIAGYRYRVVDSTEAIIVHWQETEDDRVELLDLNLATGQSYHFEVEAIYASGNYSKRGYSPGVIVDATPPVITELITPEHTSSWNLTFDWEGQDEESKISKVEAALGSDYYATDISRGWIEITDNKLNCDAYGDVLNLVTGQKYYLTLRLVNGAGLASEITATPVIIDDTPPPTPTVKDQGSYINTVQSLEANWLWTEEDPESGNVKYEWALLEDSQDIHGAVWYSAKDSLEVNLKEIADYQDFQQEHAKTYYFAVKAENSVGLTSIGISDGILADATAPFIPQIRLMEAVNLGVPDSPEVNFITSTDALGLWIESTDPESQIDKYLYTWDDPNLVKEKERLVSEVGQIELINPDIDEGNLTVFAGECLNNAGHLSATGYSTGVILDTGAPIITNVHGSVSDTNLLFDWDIISSTAPVAGTEVALVKEEDIDKRPSSWQSLGLDKSISLDGSQLEDGYYRLLIKAFNQAGTYSRRGDGIDEWGISPKVMLDKTPPIVTDLEYNRFSSAGILARVGAEDNLAGVNSYQYALGTLNNPTTFTDGWVDIMDNSGVIDFEVSTADIPHLTEVYLMVRAKDNVGLWSEAVVSDRILIDHTPPEAMEVKTGDYTTSQAVIDNIEYLAGDDESVVTHYKLSVVEEVNGEWLTEPEPMAVEEFDGQLTGLNLIEAEEYYLLMQVRNAAGLWSVSQHSKGVIVDTIEPVLNFTQASNEIVLNFPPKEIEFSISEESEIDFRQVNDAGFASEFSQHVLTGVDYFTFEEGIPGTYTLYGTPTDLAGNIGDEKSQAIRVNNPPVVILPDEIYTTPGKPMTLSGVVVDYDGMAITYKWTPGDQVLELNGPNPEYHYDQLGDYILTLTVTDNDGGVTTVSTTVKVRNTTQGRLYLNETWSGAHRLVGDVLVPEGLNLTIEEGTQLLIDGIPGDTGYNHALNIEGSMTATGVDIYSSQGKPGSWHGILIRGKANLDNVTLQHATRGVAALIGSDVTISSSTFRENRLGVHVYGAFPLIDNSVFLNNSWYGIKEDISGRPTVYDCLFDNNGIDYYTQESTRINIEELNAMGGNSGNSQQ